MKVVVTGHSEDLSMGKWWYADCIGHVFDVYEDPKYNDSYLTVDPVFKDFQGNIKKSDCKVLPGSVTNLRHRLPKRM